MIDAKGRLFGKINLLDLVVILAVLAVGGRFVYKHYAARQGGGAVQSVTAVIKFANVTQPTIDAVKAGDVVVNEKGVTLGQVTGATPEPAKAYQENSAGIRTYQEAPGYFNLNVTIVGPGSVKPDGSSRTLNGVEMLVGRTYQLHSANWASTGVDVTPVPAK